MKRPRSPRPLLLVAALALLGLAVSACGSSSPALEVGDRSISRSDLTEQLEGWGAAIDMANESGVDAGASAQWASWWIRFTALEEWAEAEGIAVSDADVDEATQVIAASFPEIPVEGNVALEQLVQWQALLNVLGRDEDLLAATLEANPSLQAPLLCSRHILLETEDEADEVLELLEDGEDFATLAADRSIDPSAATNGGDLGCQPQGTFVPEFEEAAFAAETGETVGPVETEFGFHVIEVLSLEEPAAEDLAGQLSQIIQGELIQGTSTVFADALDGSGVLVDARYGSWDEAIRSVVPPSGPLAGDPVLQDLAELDTGS